MHGSYMLLSTQMRLNGVDTALCSGNFLAFSLYDAKQCDPRENEWSEEKTSRLESERSQGKKNKPFTSSQLHYFNLIIQKKINYFNDF